MFMHATISRSSDVDSSVCDSKSFPPKFKFKKLAVEMIHGRQLGEKSDITCRTFFTPVRQCSMTSLRVIRGRVSIGYWRLTKTAS